MQKRIWISLTIVLLLTACRQQSQPNDSQDTKITTDTISQTTGSRQASDSAAVPAFQTMGKVVATHYADVKFEIALPVLRMMVHNGDRVRQGQLLAEQDATRQTNAVEQHQREIDQAHLQMQDVIISQGYDPEHMDNVTAHAGQLAQVGDIVCRVISPQQMDVEFRIMEADLSRFGIGTRLQVVPVGDEHTVYEAKVTEVNPIVDAQGTVMLRAHVNTPHQLFDGMHVSVTQNTTQP